MASSFLTYFISSSGFIYFLSHYYCSKLYIFSTFPKNSFWRLTRVDPQLTLIEPFTMFFFLIANTVILFTFKINKNLWSAHDQLCFFYLSNSLAIMFIFFLFSLFFKKNVTEINVIYLILSFFFIFLAKFRYVTNLLTFTLALELISVSYYYYFINKTNSTQTTFIQLKNFLSFYLWLSFCTLILLVLTVYVLCYLIGTINFKELQCLSYQINGGVWSLLIISLLWKMGAPGFHFFKLELYRYLSFYFFIFFSVITLYLNCFILSFIGSTMPLVLKFNALWILLFILILNVVLLSQGFYNIKFYQFVALSSVNSLSFCLMLFLLNVTIFF